MLFREFFFRAERIAVGATAGDGGIVRKAAGVGKDFRRVEPCPLPYFIFVASNLLSFAANPTFHLTPSL